MKRAIFVAIALTFLAACGADGEPPGPPVVNDGAGDYGVVSYCSPIQSNVRLYVIPEHLADYAGAGGSVSAVEDLSCP